MEVFHDDEKVGRSYGYGYALLAAVIIAGVASAAVWVLS